MIYFITDIGNSYGKGHFTRMCILASYLKKHNNYEISFSINYGNELLKSEIQNNGFDFSYIDDLLKSDNKNITIIDKRETDKELIKRISKVSKVIIIDSIGGEREYADIVIEMLPSLEGEDKSNLVNIRPFSLTILNTIDKNSVYDKNAPILIYLGFIDELKKNVVDIVSKIKGKKFILIDDSDNFKNYENIEVKKFSTNIFNIPLSAVITYYGLTAFEAISFSIPVVLINPTDYHSRLSDLCADIFTHVRDIDDLHDELSNNNFDESKKETKINVKSSLEKFNKIINNIKNFFDINCPVCESEICYIANRDEESNLYRCENCHTLFRRFFLDIGVDFYGADYFEDDYKKQYGKTYKEDYDNLSQLAKNRINNIKTKKQNGHILDLGAAMGFFLKNAKDDGFTVEGVEISGYASNYCKEDLKLDVKNVSVMDFEFEKDKYDIITAWYVLEHIKELDDLVLRIHNSLKKGGIFAFAMPNCYGTTGRFRKLHYHTIVPKDHAFEFSPYSIDLYLKKYGFSRFHLENKGVYFNRFLSSSKWLKIFANNFIGHAWYKHLNKKHNLGDTFEAYYIKD